MQNLAASVDVSKTAQIMTTIDPHSGQTGTLLAPDQTPEYTDNVGNYYFVRFSSLNLRDSQNSQYPYQAYSAKFTYVPFHLLCRVSILINSLDEMVGTFNATILAAISSDPAASSASASVS